METLFQILVGAATLMLLGLGTTSMFAPRKMTKNFALEPIGAAGLNTIRSVIGGLFLTSVALLAYGLITGTSQTFVVVALLLGVVALGRLVGILADGFDKAVVPPLLVEFVMVAILLGAYFQPF
ncbi:DUF4345 domain-containing protein [Rhodobacteraceae bacterium RKSG542]|uniref:DUF4345 family protein n=1 Tax=Pseudovibrio flavus TaxID=2529854 RepID=UPI0012BD37F6|nr:DUF4345 family protein [Pseudovibrio flavus]MTI17099.1 DUF4345 domain-containing protein [Pseudovibrio flavus]